MSYFLQFSHPFPDTTHTHTLSSFYKAGKKAISILNLQLLLTLFLSQEPFRSFQKKMDGPIYHEDM